MGVTNIPQTIFNRTPKVVYTTYNSSCGLEQKRDIMLPCHNRTSGDPFDTTFGHSSYRKDLHVTFPPVAVIPRRISKHRIVLSPLPAFASLSPNFAGLARERVLFGVFFVFACQFSSLQGYLNIYLSLFYHGIMACIIYQVSGYGPWGLQTYLRPSLIQLTRLFILPTTVNYGCGLKQKPSDIMLPGRSRTRGEKIFSKP